MQWVALAVNVKYVDMQSKRVLILSYLKWSQFSTLPVGVADTAYIGIDTVPSKHRASIAKSDAISDADADTFYYFTKNVMIIIDN